MANVLVEIIGEICIPIVEIDAKQCKKEEMGNSSTGIKLLAERLKHGELTRSNSKQLKEGEEKYVPCQVLNVSYSSIV
ncbi:hypothetical protein LXL04_025865 [Taraxacum kok-saghyz]